MSDKKFAAVVSPSLHVIERMTRAFVGAVALLVVLTSAGLPIAWAFAFTMFGVYTVLTGIVGADPVYAAIGHGPRRSVQHPVPKAPARRPASKSRRPVYKHAA